jgi:hypothetical protein
VVFVILSGDICHPAQIVLQWAFICRGLIYSRYLDNAMTLKSLDDQHFYIDDRLIDLNRITFNTKKQINAANYHDMQRNLNWLKKLARRLTENPPEADDEAIARRRLTELGYGFYFET